MENAITMQVTMLALILLGILTKKIGLISAEGQKNITDLVLYLILPCNIVKSFLIEVPGGLLQQFGAVFAVSIAIQAASSLLAHLLYRRSDDGRHKTLRYGVIASNAGFLGNPVAEGVFGPVGLAMASVYLIPMRIVMWSNGLAVFAGNSDPKATAKKVLTHPCILAVFIGVALMVSGVALPGIVVNCLSTVGNCNTALSMMVIGMILADTDIRTLFDWEILRYCLLRLILMPAAVDLVCLPFDLPPMVQGVSVLLTAMPAAATTSILASKYRCNEQFATRLVVSSTLLSMITIPIWNLLLT